MTTADWQRAAAIYLPLVAAALAGLLHPRRPRQLPAVLLATLWTLPTLVLLQVLNQQARWWTFDPGAAATLHGLPVELLIGWTLLWGVLPQVAWPELGILRSTAALLALDCVLMPVCSPAIHLGRNWLIGEGVAAALVLLPALALAQRTRRNLHVRRRAVLQMTLAGILFLFFLPELAFAARPGIGWSALIAMPSWLRQLGLQAVFLLAIPGIAAVLEFAERGNGTPIPYDPPPRLVTSGIYRYVANPMQLSCTAVLLAWALLLRNGWLLLAPLMAVVYSVGLATWDEAADLHTRFGDPWTQYRAAVSNWRPRWRPFHAGPDAVLYIARGCGPCSQLRRWIEARHPLGLTVLDAESLPAGTIQRMRYDPRDGTPAVHGVRAMARVLEHLHLGWAYCGAALGLPGIRHFIQLCMDAGGLGPRTLPAKPSPINSHLTCLPLISKQTSTPNAWKS